MNTSNHAVLHAVRMCGAHKASLTAAPSCQVLQFDRHEFQADFRAQRAVPRFRHDLLAPSAWRRGAWPVVATFSHRVYTVRDSQGATV